MLGQWPCEHAMFGLQFLRSKEHCVHIICIYIYNIYIYVCISLFLDSRWPCGSDLVGLEVCFRDDSMPVPSLLRH